MLRCTLLTASISCGVVAGIKFKKKKNEIPPPRFLQHETKVMSMNQITWPRDPDLQLLEILYLYCTPILVAILLSMEITN